MRLMGLAAALAGLSLAGAAMAQEERAPELASSTNASPGA
jgi:hypothetical protein